MRPDIGAVLCQKNRHISHNLDAMLSRILMEFLPLNSKQILHELDESCCFIQMFTQSLQGFRFPVFYRIWPARPFNALIFALGSLKQGIIIEPIRFLPAEFLIIRIFIRRQPELGPGFFEAFPFEGLHPLKVDKGRRIRIGDMRFCRCQPFMLNEHIYIDQQWITRKC